MFRTTLALFMLILMAGTATAENSPIDKGSIFIDGSVYFRNYSGDLFEDRDGDGITAVKAGKGGLDAFGTLTVSPAFGIFVQKGLALGMQVAIEHYSFGNDDLTVYAFGPSLTYYFETGQPRDEIKGAVYPYVRGFGNYGHASGGDGIDIWQFGVRGGLLWMLSNAVALDASAKLQRDSWGDGDESESGTIIELGAGIATFIY